MTDNPEKIAFFGHFGSLNTGNESTLISILARFRDRLPEAQFLCICTDPMAVRTRDQIDAIPITTRLQHPRRGAASRSQRLRIALAGAAAEFRQYLRAFTALKGTDVLIIPGTGLVTDAFGLYAWGPANLLKWVVAAKLRRARVMFVSVGAGPLHSTRGRLIAGGALLLADYRSYRDRASRDYLARIGLPTKNDQVYPDLVFSLPDAMLSSSSSEVREERRRVVGLGLMLYPGKYSRADPQPETPATYVQTMAEFAGWLIQAGYDIRLILGDGDGDPEVVTKFTAAVSARLRGYDQGRIVSRPISSVPEVLAELAATDVVVATRFHNVLLALLLGKPVVAISFHHKCSSLMDEMKLSDYCQEIHRMDAETLIRQFREIEQNSDAVKHMIKEGVENARAALDEQYDLLLDPR